MRSKICYVLFLIILSGTAKSQSSLVKYDSAISLIEKAQLVPAVNLLQEIKNDLYVNKNFKEYFGAQYYFAVYYALVDRNPKAAEDSLRLNLEKAISIGGDQSLEAAEMYFGLGWLNDNEGREELAGKFYKKALDIQIRELDSIDKKVLKTMTNYAQVLTATGKLGRAEQYLNEILETYPQVYPQGHPEYVRVYTLAFNYYQLTIQKEKSLSYALAALELGIKNYGESNPRTLSLIRNVSMAHHYAYSDIKALEFTNKELELLNILLGDTPHIRKAEVLNNIGQFSSKMDENTAAEEALRKALSMKQELLGNENPSTINSSINLAFALIENQKLEESTILLDKVLKTLQASNVDEFDINYQRAIHAKTEILVAVYDREPLKELVNESFEIFKDNFHPSLLAGDKHINIMAIVENLSSLSNYQSAPILELQEIYKKIQWLDSINSQAISSMNLQADQLNFLEDYSNFNGVAIDNFYQLYSQTSDDKYLRDIFLFSEKNKATILSQEYTIARLKDQLNVPLEILELERKLLAEIMSGAGENSQEQLELKLSYDSIKNLLKEGYPDYYSLKYNQELADLRGVQGKLQVNQIILSYTLSENYLYRIDIRNSSVAIHRQPLAFLAETSISLRDQIVALDDIESTSKRLYSVLIPDNLSLGDRLIISPEDFLSFIPFDLLYSGNEYLGLVSPISYSPSIEMWIKSTSGKKSSSTKVLAMAPDFGNRSDLAELDVTRELLVPIPGAEKEIDLVKSNYGGETLRGSEATLQNFIDKVSSYGIIHLATHAIIDNENPNFSRLYFSKSADGSESFLYNYELYNLNINANLVTLSACNTGIGEIQKGEGVNSLARGFTYAGVPSTVVSLWPASDKSTPELMKYFYQNLKEGQTKDVALNNARKQYLATAQGKARHPFYWGGFVLIGDNSPIEEDTNLLVYVIPAVLAFVMILTVYRRRKQRA